MPILRRDFLHLAAGTAALSVLPHAALAQAYPARPVRMIVPFAPGGQNDAIGRLIAQKLSEHLGKQFIVENVGGGGGSIQSVETSGPAADTACSRYRQQFFGRAPRATIRAPTPRCFVSP